MARWFVGQRVRLVKPWFGYSYPEAQQDWNQIKGQQGIIISVPALNPFGQMAIEVRLLAYDVFMPEYGLEPILPEGMQPVSWSECLWQPEGEKVS